MSLMSLAMTSFSWSNTSVADLPYSRMMERSTLALFSSTTSASTPFLRSLPPRPSWIMDRTLPFMSMMPSTFCAAREEIFSTTFSSMVSLY